MTLNEFVSNCEFPVFTISTAVDDNEWLIKNEAEILEELGSLTGVDRDWETLIST